MEKIKKTIVVINEQHTLLPDQKRALREQFPGAEIEKCLIPANGLSAKKQRALAEKLACEHTQAPKESDVAIVFVSPVPVLLARTSKRCAAPLTPVVAVFHNDRREKKELPNGKVISVIAHEGWTIEII